jgi:hypothetical protein
MGSGNRREPRYALICTMTGKYENWTCAARDLLMIRIFISRIYTSKGAANYFYEPHWHFGDIYILDLWNRSKLEEDIQDWFMPLARQLKGEEHMI